MSGKVSDFGEFQLIDLLLQHGGKRLPGTIVGPGDDCAVVPLAVLGGGVGDTKLVLSVDAMVEERHFNVSYMSGREIGWKLLASNLSDIAAMGACPKLALLTIQLPAKLDASLIEEVYRGMENLAQDYDVHVVGGDTVESEVFSLGMSIVGSLSGQPLLRSGASPGEELWVSGVIGAAEVGLDALLDQKSFNVDEEVLQLALSKHKTPEPRVKLGEYLQANCLATSAIDVSDGLLQDANHLASSSGVSIEVLEGEVPLLDTFSNDAEVIPRLLTAGDDYELLFTAPATCAPMLKQYSQDAAIDLHRIGIVRPRENEGVVVNRGDRILSMREYSAGETAGYQHFTG